MEDYCEDCYENLNDCQCEFCDYCNENIDYQRCTCDRCEKCFANIDADEECECGEI